MLLALAWGWIMATVGVVLYHGYAGDRHRHGAPGPPPTKEDAVGAPAAPEDAVAPRIPGQLRPRESPLLVFTCKRADYLRRTLDGVFRYLPSAADGAGGCLVGCPVVISQDGADPDVSHVIDEYATKFWVEKRIPVLHWRHPPPTSGGLRGAAATDAYQALAAHYGWALSKLFRDADPPLVGRGAVHLPVAAERVLILEEDLAVAPDFFGYFQRLAPLLDEDPSLLAVSAFNDNGFRHPGSDPARVLRSDFFPGLGWMMTRRLWRHELEKKWPPAYWDDWLREPEQRRGRHVLRPEVSRTFHFGTRGGASGNQFGSKLSSVFLNPTPVNWTAVDLSPLRADRYDRRYWRRLEGSRRAATLPEALELVKAGDVRLEYSSLQEFKRAAEALGIMADEKAGVPRTAYRGVVEHRPVQGANGTLFLSPPLPGIEKVRAQRPRRRFS
jgi:alpha-1,3-mannosyl-glycoprotein beta-1,2-N-acetylglucosaminyltransferase